MGGETDYSKLDRDQLIARLRQLESQLEDFRLLMAQAPDGVFVTDAQERCIDVNKVGRRLFGYAREEIMGKRLSDIIAPDEVARLTEELGRYAGGAVVVSEWNFLRKDGSSFLGEMVGRRMPDGRLLGILRDVTERRQHEAALRESESFFRQSLESIPGMVFTTHPDGYCDYQSQQWADYTGVPVSEHLGDGWNALQHPDDRARSLAAWHAAVEERAPYDLEYRVRRHDGVYEWFRVIGRPIRDASGRIARWFGVAVNIENLKQAEQLLRESELQLRQARDLLESVTTATKVLIATVDSDFRYTFFNQLHHDELKRLTGKDTTIGMSMKDVLADMPAERAKALAIWARALNGETVVQTLQFGDSRGYRRWYNVRHAPIRNSSGQIVGAGEVTSDVTELEQIQEALRDSESRLRLLIEHIPAAMALLDLDMRYVVVNRRWLDDFGLYGRSIIGLCHYDVFPEIDETLKAIHRRGMAGEVVKGDEERFERVDGRVQWLRWEMQPWHDAEGNVGGIVLFSEDVTERREMEVERVAAIERQRDTLVREVNHRIKNHLQGVLGLMCNAVVKNPGIAGVMEGIVVRVRRIAEVYGLQGQNQDQRIRFVDLLRSAADGASGLVPVECRFQADSKRFLLAQEEAVPMALIINEVITNAVKHIDSADPGRPVSVSVEPAATGGVRAEIRSGPAFLPERFDFSAGIGIGTGLELLRTLMPPTGAKLEFRQEADEVVVELLLTTPVVVMIDD